MTKHTKGPWSALNFNVKVANGIEYHLHRHPDSGADPNEMLANAHLIAAAPDLLGMLEEMLDCLKEEDSYPEKGSPLHKEMKKLYKKATN